VSQQQNPLERAVDLFVFAPLGVAMFAKDTVPTFLKMFVSRGQTEMQHRKKSLADHANQYRAVGRFAVKYGGPEVRRTATDKFDGARKLAEETFTGLVVPRLPGQGPTPEPAPAPVPKPAKVVKPKPAKETAGAQAPAKAKTAKVKTAPVTKKITPVSATAPVNGSAVAEPALAIPEYDQLSASQVVERLDGLTPSELDEVRAYELAHRGRSTILGKIVQLTA
jgi:hypothetical protein